MEKILDDSLITSEVCVQCGHCCKWTTSMQHVHPENGKEWLNVLGKHDRTKLLWYENETVEHESLSEGRTVTQERAAFKIQITCPQLQINEEAGGPSFPGPTRGTRRIQRTQGFECQSVENNH